MYFRILFINYLKNFLIIFLSLSSFFVFMDFMLNKAKLPDSTNLQILYIGYNFASAGLMLYPLSLLLSLLITIMALVKRNEMIAFLSLGYSLKILLKPIISVALGITIFFILLQMNITTSFRDSAKSISSGKYFSNINKNLFFKFNNNIIFIKRLDVVNKTAYNMVVYNMEKGQLGKIYNIKKSVFSNNTWRSDTITLHEIKNNKMVAKKVSLTFLNGFKPDILNKLETKQSMTLKLAFQTLYLLKKENIDINFIKTYIYNAIIPPLSFVLLLVIIFLRSPIHSRISNSSLFMASGLFFAITLWASFLLINKMSISGIISADIAFITPFIILLSFTIYYFRKI